MNLIQWIIIIRAVVAGLVEGLREVKAGRANRGRLNNEIELLNRTTRNLAREISALKDEIMPICPVDDDEPEVDWSNDPPF